MGEAVAPLESFFVAGGTVPPGSPSYIERSADRELYEALLAGEYCYVLNSRQMGKSSLAVRTIAKLSEAGVKTAFVDLTRIGGANVTHEQWYAGLLLETGRALGLRAEAAAWLKEHREVGPAQRLFSFLHEAVLLKVEGSVVLMIDEIDAVRSLGFSTDELFAGLRQLHNGRSTDPPLRRLTICLLGAALPSDLIRDPRVTPFNVGRRVELRDFTADEAKPLAQALPNDDALTKLLGWTGGHPFLTQAIGAEVGKEGDVDLLVAARYLDARARDTDTNLSDVGRRLLGEGDPDVGVRERADTLALYERILQGKPVPDDESNPAAARIKMSGVVRLENGQLKPRNRIYESVFDRRWVRENMPGQELRRQKRAFWKGALRTAAIATAVVASVGYLALTNARQRDRARYDAYVASMRTLNDAYMEGNLVEMNRILKTARDNPARGWEWSYWNRLANPSRSSMDLEGFRGNGAMTQDGRFYVALSLVADSIGVFGLRENRLLRRIPVTFRTHGNEEIGLANGNRWAVLTGLRGEVIVVDLESGRELRRAKFPKYELTRSVPGARKIYGVSGTEFVEVDLATLELRKVDDLFPTYRGGPRLSPDGRYVSWFEAVEKKDDGKKVNRKEKGKPEILASLTVARTLDGKPIDSFEYDPLSLYPPTFSPDGRHYARGLREGYAIERDFLAHSTEQLAKFPGWALEMSYSPDGKRIVASTNRKAALVWDDRKRTPRVFLNGQQSYFDPSGKELLTTYGDLYRYRLDEPPKSPSLRLPHIAELRLPSRSPLLYADKEKGRVYAIDLTRPSAKPVEVGPYAVGTQLFAVRGRWARTPPSSRPAMEVGRAGDPKPVIVAPLLDRSEAPSALSPISEDMQTFVVAGCVYEFPNPRPVAKLKIDSPIASGGFIDDRWLVASHMSGEVSLYRRGQWDAPVWKLPRSRLGGFLDCAISPDKSKLALAFRSQETIVVDFKTGKILQRLVGHLQGVVSVAWSPDGKRIATGGYDYTIRLWDSETGEQLCQIANIGELVSYLQFLPGGRTLVSASPSGVKYWMTEDRL